MIPDFPNEKQKLQEFWNRYLNIKTRQLLGYLNQIPRYRNHEGHEWLAIQSNGMGEKIPYNQISAILDIDEKEVPYLTLDMVKEKLDQVAKELTQQMTRDFFVTINHVVDPTGNTIDAKGQPFSKEMLLEMLDKVEMEFDDNGNPINQVFFVTPEFWKTNKERIAEWDKDVDVTRKHDAIIANKRKSWNDRESNRKLVD